MDPASSDSVASIAHSLPPAKAKLRKSPARPKPAAPIPKEEGSGPVAEPPELVEVKQEPLERVDVPPTQETILPALPPEVREPALCLVALRPEQVMEVALMAALLAVGLYKLSDAISGLFDHFFPTPE